MIHDARFVANARLFAIAAHDAINHRRKYTGEPYTVHLQAVADALTAAGCDELTVAAGWLHDVLEDTAVTPERLRAEFGDPLTDLVLEVSNIDRPEHGNRAARAEINRRHFASGSERAKAIKAADITHNLSTIVDGDIQFARIWLAEKRAVRPDLEPAGVILLVALDAEMANVEKTISAHQKSKPPTA